MEKEKSTLKPTINIDIGAGFAENFIKKAQENPDKIYLAIEPFIAAKKPKLPENFFWIEAGVDERNKLPLADNSVDEVNIDCVFWYLCGENKENIFPLLLDEAIRVLKDGGRILIREPYVEVENGLKSLLERLEIKFTLEEIPLEEAKRHSVSLKDAALEFEVGKEKMKPMIVVIKK